jgi:hypothetical protein
VAEQSIPLFGYNDLEARGGLLYTLAVVAHQAGRKSCPGSASRRKINSKGTAVLNARRAGNRGKSKRRLKATPVFG